MHGRQRASPAERGGRAAPRDCSPVSRTASRVAVRARTARSELEPHLASGGSASSTRGAWCRTPAPARPRRRAAHRPGPRGRASGSRARSSRSGSSSSSPSGITERTDWSSPRTGRVERAHPARLRRVSLDERRIPAEPSEQAEALLADALRSRGLAGVVRHRPARKLLRARLELARSIFPDAHWPEPDDAGLAAVLARGRRSLAEVREADPAAELLGALSPESAPTPRPRAARTRDAPGRPLGAGALRVRAATLDLLATPGFLRNARRTRARPAAGSPGAASPRAQPAGGAGDTGTSPGSGAGTTLPFAASWGGGTPGTRGRRTRSMPHPPRRGADSGVARPDARGTGELRLGMLVPACTWTPR